MKYHQTLELTTLFEIAFSSWLSIIFIKLSTILCGYESLIVEKLHILIFAAFAAPLSQMNLACSSSSLVPYIGNRAVTALGFGLGVARTACNFSIVHPNKLSSRTFTLLFQAAVNKLI